MNHLVVGWHHQDLTLTQAWTAVSVSNDVCYADANDRTPPSWTIKMVGILDIWGTNFWGLINVCLYFKLKDIRVKNLYKFSCILQMCRRNTRLFCNAQKYQPQNAEYQSKQQIYVDFSDGDDGSQSESGTLSQIPLWVCPDCRKTVEEEEKRAAESSLLVCPPYAMLLLNTPSPFKHAVFTQHISV